MEASPQEKIYSDSLNEKRLTLTIIFLIGFSSLSIEILAGKILAPYLGSTLLSWSSIIATTLLGSAIGYQIGGMFSQSKKSRLLLVFFLIALAVNLFFLPLINQFLGNFLLKHELAPTLKNILQSVGTFGSIFVLLGISSPIACQIILKSNSEPTQVAKCFYWGTSGAVVGVYFTGFFLLEWFKYSQLTQVFSLIFIVLAVLVFVVLPKNIGFMTLPVSVDNFDKKIPKDYFTFIVLFLLSAFLMAVEIGASRLSSAHLGNSVYTWTSVIGSVLLGLSIGNVIAGKCLKSFSVKSSLPIILNFSALSVLIIPMTNVYFSNELHHTGLSWVLRIVFTEFFSLIIPSILIGILEVMVSYHFVQESKYRGRAMGYVFSIWGVGGFCGAFLVTNLLISKLGVFATLLWLSLIPSMLAVFYSKRKYISLFPFLVLFFLALKSPSSWFVQYNIYEILHLKKPRLYNLIYQDDSGYGDINIFTTPANNKVRKLNINGLSHSITNLEKSHELIYQYEKSYNCIIENRFSNKKLKMLMIGGGGYVFPNYIAKKYLNHKIDVIEIDPTVTKAAKLHFGLADNPPFTIFHEDARNHISQLVIKNHKKNYYDVIIGDAFNSYNIPFHLTTVEFNDQLVHSLHSDGIYLLNIIASYKNSIMLGVIYKTLKESFTEVEIFGNPKDKANRETFVFACSKNPLNLKQIDQQFKLNFSDSLVRISADKIELLSNRSNYILQDDYSPIELLTAELVNTRRRPAYDLYFNQTYNLLLQGKTDEALDYLEVNLKGHSQYKNSLQKIAHQLTLKKDYTNAIKALKKIIGSDPNSAHKVFVNLGIIYMEQDNHSSAINAWNRAIDLNPKIPIPYFNLAQFYFKRGNDKLALSNLRVALKIDLNIRNMILKLTQKFETSLQYDKSILLLKLLLEFVPDSTEINYRLSQNYFKLKKNKQAIDFITRTLELNPLHKDALNDLALQYAMHEELNKAQSIWLKLTHVYPKNAIFHKNLAVNYWQLKEYEKSWKEVDLAIKYGGKFNDLFLSKLKKDYLIK